MKKPNRTTFVLLFAAAILFQSCKPRGAQEAEPTDMFPAVMEYLEQHADFVNSPAAPGAIGIETLVQGDPEKKLIVDLRAAKAFDTAHLAGAIHVPMNGLLSFFEHRVNAASFDTIVLVSDDGQDALFATTLLRILGYNNMFALRLGMGWHVNYADTVWNRYTSSAFESGLSTDPPPAKTKHPYPVWMSEKGMAYDLIRERVAELLTEGYKNYRITAASVFSNPGNYYIINYWPEEEYLLGHISGAFQYTPRKSLKRDAALGTIPTDKPVVIYCHQGNMSSSATAYLRLIGYEVWSLEFGTNSFMYNHHKEKGIKNLYQREEAIDYPLEGSRSDGVSKGAPPVLVGVRGEGGC